MKGMALLKGGQRSRAAQEFRALIEAYPRTDDARKAKQQLQQLSAAAFIHRATPLAGAIKLQSE